MGGRGLVVPFKQSREKTLKSRPLIANDIERREFVEMRSMRYGVKTTIELFPERHDVVICRDAHRAENRIERGLASALLGIE